MCVCVFYPSSPGVYNVLRFLLWRAGSRLQTGSSSGYRNMGRVANSQAVSAGSRGKARPKQNQNKNLNLDLFGASNIADR